MPLDTPPPTSVIPRFGLFIETLKRGMADGIGRRHDTLGPLALLLWNYFGRTLRRLTALHARFAAGALATAARRSTTPRPAGDRPRAERRPPGIPRGPVLLRFYLVHFASQLQALVDDPEMRALLAASPQAGRLLRPLWRKLTSDPLPELLRLPPKPRRSEQPLLAEPKEAGASPAALPKLSPGARASRYPAAPARPPPSLRPWPPPLSSA